MTQWGWNRKWWIKYFRYRPKNEQWTSQLPNTALENAALPLTALFYNTAIPPITILNYRNTAIPYAPSLSIYILRFIDPQFVDQNKHFIQNKKHSWAVWKTEELCFVAKNLKRIWIAQMINQISDPQSNLDVYNQIKPFSKEFVMPVKF